MTWGCSHSRVNAVNGTGVEQAQLKTKAVLFTLLTFISPTCSLHTCTDRPVIVPACSLHTWTDRPVIVPACSSSVSVLTYLEVELLCHSDKELCVTVREIQASNSNDVIFECIILARSLSKPHKGSVCGQ